MNLFEEFRALLPKTPVIIATVQAEFGDGTSSCLTVDNQLIRVIGTDGRSQGQKVFIQGDRILGNAPNLTTSTVEV